MTAGTGLQAQYFNNDDLTDFVFERVDARVSFNWADGSPDAAVDPDSFSARWSGEIEPRYTETYTISVVASDGARMWINGQLLFDQYNNNGALNESAAIDLVAGRRYDIQLEYRENGGNARAFLIWESSSQPRSAIPAHRLFPALRGKILSERFADIAGDRVEDLTSSPNFPDQPSNDWLLNNFETFSNNGSDFGKRIRGLLHPPETGLYRFFIAADETSELWLSMSGDSNQKRLIARNTSAVSAREWTANAEQASAPIVLVAGESYYIEALHKDDNGADHLAVGWRKPGGIDIKVIDGQHLSPIRPVVRLYADSATAAEDFSAPATFTVSRKGMPAVRPLHVRYNIGGSATNGVDYERIQWFVTIPAGSKTATIAISPLTDARLEGPEHVTIELLSHDRYEVGSTSERKAVATISDNVERPDGGTTVFSGSSLTDYNFYGADFTNISDPDFGNVIQANVTAVPEAFYQTQLERLIETPVVKGESLLIEFMVRSVGGPGKSKVVFEQYSSVFESSLSRDFNVSTEWARVQIPFQAASAYGTGGAKFSFQIGQQLQTLQFADVRLTKYGVSSDLLGNLNFITNNLGGNFGTSRNVSVTGQSFPDAIEVTTTVTPPETYQLQVFDKNEAVLPVGDRMKVRFWARGVAGTNPRIEAMVLRTMDFTPIVYQAIELTLDWTQYQLNLTTTQAYDLNELHLTFNSGYQDQSIQLGGLEWLNIDRSYEFGDLPEKLPTGVTYGGREATAAWRDQADQRIGDLRANDLMVNVTDANGDPLDGAQVIIRQQRHQFLFGSALNGFEGRLDPNGSDEALKYQSEFVRLFNSATDEGATQWVPSEDNYARAFFAANFADRNDLYFRGHSGIWPSRSQMPESVWNQYDALVAGGDTVAAEDYLRAQTADRILTIATDFVSLTDEWDVVNEPRANRDVMDVLGDQVLVDWYNSFRTVDASAKLSLNEFDIFSSNGNNTDNAPDLQYWLELLTSQNLVDVIGEQSHYTDSNLTDISVLGTLIDDLYNDYLIPISITELDVESKDVQLQADYLRDYLTMAFSQQGIEKITQWGFWEGRHWRPDAALYRKNFSTKPNGQAYEDLVFGKWWTDVHGTTTNGSFSSQAFLGDYKIVVQYDGQEFTQAYDHDGTVGQQANITLPVEPINYSLAVFSDNSFVTGQVSTWITNSGSFENFDPASVQLTASAGLITKNPDGTWLWRARPGRVWTNLPIVIKADDGQGQIVETSFILDVVAGESRVSGESRGLAALDTPATRNEHASWRRPAEGEPGLGTDVGDWLRFASPVTETLVATG